MGIAARATRIPDSCCPSVLPCSYLSDHIGRKPVILLGTAGMAVSIAMFGMAKSYWTMIITRCAGGVLGGVFSYVAFIEFIPIF